MCSAVAAVRTILVSARSSAAIAKRPDIGLEIQRAIDYIDHDDAIDDAIARAATRVLDEAR